MVLELKDLTYEERLKAMQLNRLEELGITKSTDLDGISVRFMKDGAQIPKGPISHITNLSINKSEVPSGLKEARVRPLYKKNNRLEVGNYKTVNIQNIISKILEKTVHDQLSKYLIDNKLIYELQFGFREKH